MTNSITSIGKPRFDALAGYSRSPYIAVLLQEFDWLATANERVLGLLGWDREDKDFSWVLLGRDEKAQYRAVSVKASLPSADEARRSLSEEMRKLADAPDAEFYQGDAIGKPVDFFSLVVAEEKLHPTFRHLQTSDAHSQSRELIAAMMRYHEDVDGNFVQQFQTTGFDARLWELYLFATFVELGYARETQHAAPDFFFTGVLGSLAIEATTANPPDKGTATLPEDIEERRAYLDNYVPIKLARVLREKLKKAYWRHPHMKDVPLVLAVQDFHSPGIMRAITYAATRYVYGYDHTLRDGRVHAERITEHRYKSAVEPSGFFNLPDAEHVSAVIVNPQGTLSKFNRLGYVARFGSRNIMMVKRGVRRAEGDGDGQPLKPFAVEVHADDFAETWVEGMVVLHNSNAKIPLDPDMVPGAAHEFLMADGTLQSIVPDFHPLFSETIILTEKPEDAIPKAAKR